MQEKPEWIAFQRKRWAHPNAKLWRNPNARLWRREDYARFLAPQERKYSPEQPRDEDGKWTDWVGHGDDAGSSGAQGTAESDADAISEFSATAHPIGRLVAEIPVPGGRRCVYSFGTFAIVVPGSTNFSCSTWMPIGGTTHGYLLNEN